MTVNLDWFVRKRYAVTIVTIKIKLLVFRSLKHVHLWHESIIERFERIYKHLWYETEFSSRSILNQWYHVIIYILFHCGCIHILDDRCAFVICHADCFNKRANGILMTIASIKHNIFNKVLIPISRRNRSGGFTYRK